MVTFKCLRSGNTVSFTDEQDIEGLRKHEGYVEVKPERKDHEEEIKETTEKVLRKRGRPRKEK